MPVCKVYIMGYSTRYEHKRFAMDLLQEFKKITDLQPEEHYQPQWMLVHEETREAVREALNKARCKWIISIGLDMTLMLRDLYQEITPIPTIFFGIPNNESIRQRIIDSCERPGGWMSGVRTLDITPQPYSHEGSQDLIRFLLPVVKKILIPYDLASWEDVYDTKSPAMVASDITGVATELERIGFTPIVERISGIDEMHACINKNIAECPAVSSSWLPSHFEPELVKRCALAYPKRMVISSNSIDGFRNGAAFTFQPAKVITVIPDVIRMVRKGWYEHIWPGIQPLTTILVNRNTPKKLLVNPFMLPTLPANIIRDLQNNPDIIIKNEWPIPIAQLNELRKKLIF